MLTRGRLLCAQQGQAMIETLIVCLTVLVPLFLAIPLLGKYLDVRTAAVQSARYAAWERTVWYGGGAASSLGWFGANNRWKANAKSDDEIRSEIATRILSRNSVGNVSNDAFSSINDKSASGFRNGGTLPLWTARDGSPMLAEYGDVTGRVANQQSPGSMNRVLTPIANFAATLGPFTLEMNGRYKANIDLGVKQFKYESQGGDYAAQQNFSPSREKWVFSESSTLVANGWSAKGANGDSSGTGVKGQISGLTPTSLLKSSDCAGDDYLCKGLNIAQTILSIPFPEFNPDRKLQMGKIKPDIVPEDRLGNR